MSGLFCFLTKTSNENSLALLSAIIGVPVIHPVKVSPTSPRGKLANTYSSVSPSKSFPNILKEKKLSLEILPIGAPLSNGIVKPVPSGGNIY
jgi:hypothetical protein